MPRAASLILATSLPGRHRGRGHGATNRRLAAAVDERAGRKGFDGSSSTWSDAEATFDYWAERLSIRLATLRALDQSLSSP